MSVPEMFQNVPGEEGNTKPPPKRKKKKFSPAKHWCFTLHYENEEEYKDMLFQCSSSLRILKACVGREKGKSGATPHLQGYISYKKKCRHEEFDEWDKIHFEPCKGNEAQNVAYCSKEKDVLLMRGFPKPVIKMTYDMLKPWQSKIADKFVDDEDPLWGRKVYWYWEETGGVGKSVLCKYLVDNAGALVVMGKNGDILYGISRYIEVNGEAPRMVVVDIPRTNDGHVSFQAIESVKNGFFFSPKYEGKMVRFNSPHVIIFSNVEPWYEKLSSDRWVVEHISSGDVSDAVAGFGSA